MKSVKYEWRYIFVYALLKEMTDVVNDAFLAKLFT